jgi:hypothetical protein
MRDALAMPASILNHLGLAKVLGDGTDTSSEVRPEPTPISSLEASVKRIVRCIGVLLLTAWLGANEGVAASQDQFELPAPYAKWESDYLRAFPELQTLMDAMVRMTGQQLEDPIQDILHNRVCAALAYTMAIKRGSAARTSKLVAAADLLHNIGKEQKGAVLSDANLYQQISQLVSALKAVGKFSQSPEFFRDERVLLNPKVAGNQALIHHLTGALAAGGVLRRAGGYLPDEVRDIEVAIIAHSTGYWYFRSAVDDAAGRSDAWRAVYPEPEGDIAQFAHDADLVSQFVPESVIPEGSKWRNLAQKRWQATSRQEEAQIVHYVFLRLYGEARTEEGKALAREKWDVIRPALIQLMALPPDADPVKTLGVPKVFAR